MVEDGTSNVNINAPDFAEKIKNLHVIVFDYVQAVASNPHIK